MERKVQGIQGVKKKGYSVVWLHSLTWHPTHPEVSSAQFWYVVVKVGKRDDLIGDHLLV